MKAEQMGWEARLSELRNLTCSDFCAVAIYDTSVRQIRWVAATGYTNEKFRSMVNRPNQGIAGDVIRIGRTVQRTCMSDEQRRDGDYMMFAERLLVAAATPTQQEPNNPVGILLIGRRTGEIYGTSELTLLEFSAQHFWEESEMQQL